MLEQLGPLKDVEIIGIVVNEKGAERAIATGGVSTLGYPYSISETFLRRNQNQSREENEAVMRRIAGHARDAGLQMVAYISMAFGNPYGDAWSEEEVAKAASMIATVGIHSVSLADTIGAAEPDLIHRVMTTVNRDSGECEIGVHLHSTRTAAAQKILAAYDAGCRRFDCRFRRARRLPVRARRPGRKYSDRGSFARARAAWRKVADSPKALENVASRSNRAISRPSCGQDVKPAIRPCGSALSALGGKHT